MNRLAAHSHVFEWEANSRLDTSLKSNQLRPSGAPGNLARGTPAREVRRLEDVPIVPSFGGEKQAEKPVFVPDAINS